MASDDTITDGWLSAIARDSWVAARIDAAAECAGASVAEVAALHPDRWSALAAWAARLDRAALAEAGDDRDASVRDRLFAQLMARFDAAEPHKATARVLAAAAPRDPALAAFVAAHGTASLARLANAAGVDTGGWLGPLRVAALLALLLPVMRTWLDDGDADLAATMKALDAALARAEGLARRGLRGSPATPASTGDLAAE